MTHPRIPRHRPAVIPLGHHWYEATPLHVAAVIALALAAFAVYALAVVVLS